MQHLVDTNGSISIGDKVFSNFDYVESGLTTFDASKIRVVATVDSSGIYYLTWQGNMSLLSSTTATADLVLNYSVTATSGQIDMIDQLYTGSAQTFTGTSREFLAIDETVRNSSGALVANSHLDLTDPSDPFAEAGDNLFVNPGQSRLNVTKDISFGAFNGGFIALSEVRQSFHQVPEASTTGMFLLGVALAGAATIYRRRAA